MEKNISPEPTYYNGQAALCKDKNAMLTLFQMLTSKELSTPVWLGQVRQIATEAKEALDEITRENRIKQKTFCAVFLPIYIRGLKPYVYVFSILRDYSVSFEFAL